jgi:hypothetical protein
LKPPPTLAGKFFAFPNNSNFFDFDETLLDEEMKNRLKNFGFFI